ncbi:hypothetical protein CRM22_005680 [Opisthorchis felineus]|uniref:SERRATE/Ars2 N-terminal domain-containing protein n=2 Tax=Opisthorchis felineus TaxID=147828 RepID=A0A4S2LW22_OPIFE|nr:hypothetical protein CRM22_005680 [Opisthorchis felineus]
MERPPEFTVSRLTMADSEEEMDRHRSRDKFRRERSDYDNRRRPGDKREPFDDRVGTANYIRNEHRTSDVRQLGNDRGRSPAAEPPPYKRSRRDDDYRNTAPKRRDMKAGGNFEDDSMYRPPLVPFKRFLEPLDDLITEEEACNKYREYKESYSKRHIEEFFEAHKNEEWLRLRYHPDHMPYRKEAIAASLKHRLNVFMDLYERGFFDNQSVQMDNSENLIRLMDTVVIKLEGGTDDDLKVLDVNDQARQDELESRHRHTSISSTQNSAQPGSGHKSEEGEAESDLDGEDSDKNDSVPQPLDRVTDLRSRRRDSSHDSIPSKRSHRSGSRSCSVHSSDEEGCLGHLDRSTLDTQASTNDRASALVNDLQEDAGSHDLRENGSNNAFLNTEEDDNDVPTPTTAENPGDHLLTEGLDSVSSVLLGSTGEKPLPESPESLASADTKTTQQQPEVLIATSPKKSWPLHKTASIFFRALPPSVTEAELKELCASQPGFLRLAMWDPVPERRFMRHAWATYKPTVNIKKICWALNTSPLLREKVTLPNGELGATVNRDLAQRVRPLTPLTRHKPVMRHDLMLASQLVARLDAAHGLWQSEDDGADVEQQATEAPSAIELKSKSMPALLGLAIRSKNPLLKNLTDYLVEEGGSEEEALLAESNQNESEEGIDGGHNGRPIPVVLEYDPVLAKALDYLILYLRVVHSVDFYAGAIYPMEDSMPHRCGILHARGDRGLNPTLPGGRSAGLVFNQREISDHIRNFGLKLRGIIDVPKDLTEEEMKKLGMRDPEKAAEEFVEANIQKRTGKKKPFKVVWVCPLSDKKFREPIFVRKHIFNKHMEKVEAAKKDNAIFFNNYLRDPRRPSLPEAPYHITQHYFGSSAGGGGGYRGNRGSGRAPGGGNYRGNYRGNNPNNPLLPGSVANYGRPGGAFQDYYDVAAQQQQQQAMAAVAAAAAAALYPNTAAADLYALAAGSGAPRAAGTSVNRRGQRGSSPNEFNPRPYHNDTRRRQNPSYNTNPRRPFRATERNMVSYNDLDDPNNEGM